MLRKLFHFIRYTRRPWNLAPNTLYRWLSPSCQSLVYCYLLKGAGKHLAPLILFLNSLGAGNVFVLITTEC